MPDLAAVLSLLEGFGGWTELRAAVRSGRPPHAVAAILPRRFHAEFLRLYAGILLCEASNPPDRCAGCRAWTEEGHPDLVGFGTPGEPPGIGDCRRIPAELALVPLAARRRLIVLWESDRLSLPAANSLLKVTEEPPEGGFLLFLAERNAFLGTLASRMWLFSPPPRLVRTPVAPPRSDQEWLDWLERHRRAAPEALVGEIRSWTDHLIESGCFAAARELDSLRLVVEAQRLSAAMTCDILFALLKEEVSCEQLFGDLWET
jgi:DNA polymerase-3 subunit delta'